MCQVLPSGVWCLRVLECMRTEASRVPSGMIGVETREAGVC